MSILDKNETEKKVLFLRGNSLVNMIGVTDIEVAYILRNKYTISILARKRYFESEVNTTHSLNEAEVNNMNGVNIIEVPYLNIPYFGSFFFNIGTFLKLRSLDFDVIIVNPGLFITAYLYKRLHKKSKIVLDIRSIPVDSSGLRIYINKAYLKFSLNSDILSGITIITKPMFNYLKKGNLVNLQLPVAFWSSGVNRSIFKPMDNKCSKYLEKSDKLIITYHGTLSQNRGIHNLIKAVYLLIKEGFDNLRLLLVGSGKDEDYFKEEVIRLGIKDYVKFTGLVPYNKVPSVISIADLAVIPLPKSEWWEYQSPIKIFEYLAMGIPMIATDLQAHRHISDSISLIPENSPETISHYIKTFVKLDSNSRKKLKEIAIKDSANYTWENQANILSQYLEKNMF